MKDDFVQSRSKEYMELLILSSLNLQCHFQPLQDANCCRNSRLVVDGEDLKRMKNKKMISLLLKLFHENFPSKTPR